MFGRARTARITFFTLFTLPSRFASGSHHTQIAVLALRSKYARKQHFPR